MITNVLKCGDGKAKTYAIVIDIDRETKLDLDNYGDGRLALWIGWPLAAKIEMDRDALERLHSFLGAALQELDGSVPEAVLAQQEEREAICE